jgi:short-subunit dehydrogenase
VEAHGRFCDVSRPEEVTASTQAVLDRWGSLDVLVNNAGIGYYGPTTKMTAAQWDKLLAVNLLAPIQFTRELLPTLLAQEEAHLLNVASFYAFFPTGRAAAYHVSKYGLLGLSEALRAEFGRRGLGVTALCPGYVRTTLYDKLSCGDARKAAVPHWVSTTPEKVAAKAIRAVYRNQRIALVTPVAYAGYYLKRFAPGLLDWLSHIGRGRAMRRKAQQALQPQVIDSPVFQQFALNVVGHEAVVRGDTFPDAAPQESTARGFVPDTLRKAA